jgi:hypothetical protein
LDGAADRLDLANPFQRKWYIRQDIEHGKAEDVAKLEVDEVARLLEELNLPHLRAQASQAHIAQGALREVTCGERSGDAGEAWPTHRCPCAKKTYSSLLEMGLVPRGD